MITAEMQLASHRTVACVQRRDPSVSIEEFCQQARVCTVASSTKVVGELPVRVNYPVARSRIGYPLSFGGVSARLKESDDRRDVV